jgi:hypothetical protein
LPKGRTRSTSRPQLGHASIQTTLDRYGHLMPEVHEAQARKLDRLVFGSEATLAVTSDGAAAPRLTRGGGHGMVTTTTNGLAAMTDNPLFLRWLRGLDMQNATRSQRRIGWISGSSRSCSSQRPADAELPRMAATPR